MYQRDGGESSVLPEVQIGYDWRGFSGLLLNVDGKSPQPLLTNQSITVNSTDGTSTKVDGEALMMFEVKYPINNVSGYNIDATSKDELDNTLLNTVYVYKQLLNGTNYVYGTDERITLLMKDTTRQSAEIPVELEHGNYILPINGTTSANLDKVKFIYWTRDEAGVSTKHEDELKVYSNQNKTSSMASDILYYYYLPIPESIVLDPATGESSPVMILEYNRQPKENIVIEDIYKFEENDEFGSYFAEIQQKVFQLDTDNYYNYTWNVPETDLIENPLDSHELWRTSNLFKRFTIPKWDAESSNIRFNSERR